nr:F61 [uncultured bacterium]
MDFGPGCNCHAGDFGLIARGCQKGLECGFEFDPLSFESLLCIFHSALSGIGSLAERIQLRFELCA